MRKSIRYAGIAVLSATMLVAGTASARDRYHGGGGGSAGAAIAVAAVAGLALGALVASQPVVAAPAPVVYAPPQPVYAPEPVSYAAPAVPPGYCYSRYDGAYVPCGRPAPVQYAPQPYYGY